MVLDCTGLTVTLVKAMTQLKDPKTVDKITMSAINAGASKVVSGIRKEVKPAKKGGDVKQIKKAVGKRNLKRKAMKAGYAFAKAGFGVGKKRGTYAPQSHILAAGSKKRFRKKIKTSTGKVVSGKFATGSIQKSGAVQRGVQASRAASLAATEKKAKQVLAREVAKVRIKGKK
jgi:hypothetical protein